MGVLPDGREERGIRPPGFLDLPSTWRRWRRRAGRYPTLQPRPSLRSEPARKGRWFGGGAEGGGPGGSTALRVAGPAASDAAYPPGVALRILVELLIELVDDRGEDSGCLARLGAHDAESFHVQQVAVDVGFLVEVESAGEMFQVGDVREVRLGESQDGEPAGYGVTPQAGRNDLQGEVLPAAEAEQVTELIAQDLLAAHRSSQRGLLDDRPELDPPLGEPPLPFLAQDDVPFRIAHGDVADREDGRGVLLGLQQAGDELGLVDA